MTNPKYIFRSKQGVYYFRIIIPKALRHLHPTNRREIRKSLRTTCLATAIRQARLLWSEYQHRFHDMRSQQDQLGVGELYEYIGNGLMPKDKEQQMPSTAQADLAKFMEHVAHGGDVKTVDCTYTVFGDNSLPKPLLYGVYLCGILVLFVLKRALAPRRRMIRLNYRDYIS